MGRTNAAPTGGPKLDLEAFSNLSNREGQVLALAAAGYLDKQISVELGVSLNTLRTYWTRVRTKVGEAPRSALAAAYVQHAAEEDLDLEPDWEIVYPERVMRVLSDRELAIPSQKGVEIPLDEVIAMVHPEDAPRIVALLEDVKTSGVDVFSYLVRVIVEGGIVITSAVVRVIRDDKGQVVRLLGRRIPNVDVRSPKINDIQVGYWEFDVRTGAFTGDKGFGKLFRVDHTSPDLRAQVRSRLHPGEGNETFLSDAITNKTERARATHRLIFDDKSTIWMTTDLRLEFEDGEPVRALGTVMSFH